MGFVSKLNKCVVIPFRGILRLSLCPLELLFFRAQWIWHDNSDTGAHSLAHFQNFGVSTFFFLTVYSVRQSESYVRMHILINGARTNDWRPVLTSFSPIYCLIFV